MFHLKKKVGSVSKFFGWFLGFAHIRKIENIIFFNLFFLLFLLLVHNFKREKEKNKHGSSFHHLPVDTQNVWHSLGLKKNRKQI